MWLMLIPIIWFVLCTTFVTYEMGWGAFWVTAAMAVIAHFFLGFSIVAFAIASPVALASWIAMYAVAGLGWASFKFFVKLRKARRLYVTNKTDWLAGADLAKDLVLHETYIPRLEEEWIIKAKRGCTERYAPTVYANKQKIMFWAWWWPFSMVNFLLEDLIREVWNASWRAIKSVMEGVRKFALGEAAKDLD
jgi:hypothetical protein